MKSQRGSFLVEAVVAIAVFSVLGLGLMRGIQTSYVGKRTFDMQSSAENMIRNQLESVFNQPYVEPGFSYAAISVPAAYSITAEAITYDIASTDIETVRVTVSQNGQVLKVSETLRANR